jgi:ankyrin repeat protein
MCRACFDGDINALKDLIQLHGVQELTGFDKHGLTPLHIAAMRNHAVCVEALLAAGVPLKTVSQNGWYAFDEALSYRSKLAYNALLDARKRQAASNLKQRLHNLAEVLSNMPDCAFQVCCCCSGDLLDVLHRHCHVSIMCCI